MIHLQVLPDTFFICQIGLDEAIPQSVFALNFYSVTKTSDEISIITNSFIEMPSAKINAGWKGFKVEGVLDFSLTGIINRITKPLKENNISVFVTSTYNTDYVFVKEANLEKTIEVLNNTPDISINNI